MFILNRKTLEGVISGKTEKGVVRNNRLMNKVDIIIMIIYMYLEMRRKFFIKSVKDIK